MNNPFVVFFATIVAITTLVLILCIVGFVENWLFAKKKTDKELQVEPVEKNKKP